MPIFSVWMLDASRITVSDGLSLSGKTQGDGSHLLKRTITLNENAWHQTFLEDDDKTFDDNDSSQRLSETQIIDGVKTAAGTIVEAEYHLTLQDTETGRTYEVFGYNVNNSNPTYGTVEGLAFRGGEGGFPPIGHKLVVIATAEGPGSGNQKAVAYDQLAYPPCFTPGTLILTPQGERRVEALRPGDLVTTRDAGPQPLRWVGQLHLPAARLATAPHVRPIRIPLGALGNGMPKRDLLVSPQHRMLVGGWKTELLFGLAEVLVAAKHLCSAASGIVQDPAPGGVTYIHLLFDRHQVIWAEGAQTESFHPAALDQPGLPQAMRDEVRAFFPDMPGAPKAARPCLAAWEAAALVA